MRFGPSPGDASRFVGIWSDLAGVGRDHLRGGYSRHAFDDAEMQLRQWFAEQAQRRGLDVENDRNGNVWAWWGAPAPGAVVTGSHLDSVPGGGAIDGLARVLAIEVMTASRGLALRSPLEPGAATGAIVSLVAGVGAVPGPDRFLSPEIEAITGLVASGEVVATASREAGALV